ncbi:hypothetical protein KPH14_013008 [Odynerus spinipes]|uniref:Uncharacterized protein n=1 Tax=Odynerus spinipes TaxID=1348599 RepID=A0AAD9R843_9HYME|nr:hypothetical protein KPH14_013008 [Odynerus spinipes]
MNKIKEAASELGMTTKTKRRKTKQIWNKPWYNKECYKNKKELKKCQKLLRKKQDYETKENYLNIRHQYKARIKTAKIEYNRKLQKDMSNIKNSKTFWGLVKKIAHKKKPECTIGISEWEKFYKELHKDGTDTNYCIIDVRHPYLDKDIEITELNIALKRLKVRKAPGPDGITNEFYKYLPDNMKDDEQGYKCRRNTIKLGDLEYDNAI